MPDKSDRLSDKAGVASDTGDSADGSTAAGVRAPASALAGTSIPANGSTPGIASTGATNPANSHAPASASTPGSAHAGTSAPASASTPGSAPPGTSDPANSPTATSDPASAGASTAAVAPAGHDPAKNKDQPPNKSFPQRMMAVAFLLLWTFPLMLAGESVIRSLEQSSTTEVSQSWKAPSGVYLDVGPEDFLYDPVGGKLTHRGPITAEREQELRKLISYADSVDESARATSGREYVAAIGRLSFDSRKASTDILINLLLLGGIFGAAGAVARIYTNFFYIACYDKGKTLDLRIWWPYYAVLPLFGFLMGVFVTVLLKANLLTIENQSASGNLWWAGISIIVGFGAQDVAERIKALGKGLFGTQK